MNGYLETILTVRGETRAVRTPRGRGDQAAHTRAVRSALVEMYATGRTAAAQKAYDSVGRGEFEYDSNGKRLVGRVLAEHRRKKILNRRFTLLGTSGPSPEQTRKRPPRIGVPKDPSAAGRALVEGGTFEEIGVMFEERKDKSIEARLPE